MAESDIRKDLTLAVQIATNDALNGKPDGNIITKGCEAAGYVDADEATDHFIKAVVDGVLKVLSDYGDDLLNDLAIDLDAETFGSGTTIVDVKPLGVAGHLRMIRQRTIEAYDAGKLPPDQLQHITPELIARWRAELEKPA